MIYRTNIDGCDIFHRATDKVCVVESVRLGLFDVGVCIPKLFMTEIKLDQVTIKFAAPVERRSNLDCCLVEIVNRLLSLQWKL